MFILIGCVKENNPVVSEEDSAFELLQQIQTAGWSNDVWCDGERVFVADHEMGIAIWDSSIPLISSPVETFKTFRPVRKAAYCPLTGLMITIESEEFSNDDPEKIPGILSIYDHRAANTHPLTSFGFSETDYAFFELDNETLILVSVSQQDGLRIDKIIWNSRIERWDHHDRDFFDWIHFESGSSMGVCYSGDIIYIANNEVGLTIVEVGSDDEGRTDLTVLGGVNTPGAARNVELNAEKTHVLIADYQSGLVIADISDKSNPELVTSIQPDGCNRAFDVFVRNDFAYVLDEEAGLYVVDIKNPNNPELIADYYTPAVKGVFVTENNLIYIADEISGLIVLRLPDSFINS